MNPLKSYSYRTWMILSSMLLLLFIIFAPTPFKAQISHDPMVLLPQGHRQLSPNDESLVQNALHAQTQKNQRQVVFLIRANTDAERKHATEQAVTTLSQYHNILIPNKNYNEQSASAWLNFYQPHAQQLLTDTQKHKLATFSDAQWLEHIQKNILSPLGSVVSPSIDPLGNLNTWFGEQSVKTRIYQNNEGQLETEEHDGVKYSVLLYETTQDAFNLSADNQLPHLIELLKQQISHQTNAQLHMAGIPLHAAYAAQQATHEISVFGGLSTVAIVLLIAIAYNSIRAVVLVSMSLVYGLLLAFVGTQFIFGQVHILTLVFGTSLIGVAEDYGFHFLAARQNALNRSMGLIKKFIRPSMLFAFLTTALAYALLGLPPFPALRQLAVFSVFGLLGALMFVWCVFPDVFEQMPLPTRLNQWFARWWQWYAQPQNQYSLTQRALVLLGFVIFIGGGLYQLRLNDDLRQMQNSPSWLLEEQRIIGRLLGQSNSQFYLVSGLNEQDLLHNEEQLIAALKHNILPKYPVQYRAVSEWLPSIQMQQDNAALTQHKNAFLNQHFGIQLPPSNSVIEPQAWLQQPFADLMSNQWLGQQTDGRWASIVSLTGNIRPDQLTDFAQIAQSTPHTLWVDNVSHFSGLLSKYRNIIMGLLLISYAATWILLWPRYRARAKWILAPSCLACISTAALLGWLGIPLQLFTVLPLLLVLGMGVDYGIFLIEHIEEQESMWMVTCLSSFSTVLSLGMLGFSQTPALHHLGISLGFGIACAWLFSAMMAKFLAHQTHS